MGRIPFGLFLWILPFLGPPTAALCQTGDAPVWLLVTDVSSQVGHDLDGSGISDALRDGLAGHDGVRVVAPAQLERIREAMGVADEAKLIGTLARQVAVRGGIPLMVEVELVRDGSAYHLETRLTDPDDGTVHHRASETAASEDDIPETVNRIIAAVGPGLRGVLPTVANRPFLSLVFTPSLEALKLHTEAVRANQETRYADALPLLEEAVRVEPGFAAGWRLLGVVLGNLGQDVERQTEALTRAYELSGELPEYERLTTAATYFAAKYDYPRSVEVLEQITERYPDRGGWNNLGLRYAQIGEYEKARDALQEAVNRGHSSLTTGNLINAAVRIGDLETARETLRIREDEGIGTATSNLNYAATIAYLTGDREEARRLDLAGAEAAATGPARATDLRLAGYVDAVEGRVDSFRQRFEEATRLWAAAGNSGVVFRNREFLAMFDAAVLGRAEEAHSRWTDALEEAAQSEAPRDPFDAGTAAFLGKGEQAREILARWEAVTPAGLRAQFQPQLHRLNGFLALAGGRTEEGLRELREAVRAGFDSPINVGELALAFDRAGMPDLALEAFHTYLDAPNVNRIVADGLFLARTYERLGQLHEARGETGDAVRFHTLFVELWAEADPELQPRVEAARSALARLGTAAAAPPTFR